MFRRVTMSLSALALILGLAFGSVAHGQESTPVTPPEGKKVEEARGVMTDEQILAFVKGLDPNAVMSPIKDGTAIRFSYAHKHLTIPLVMRINSGYAWFFCYLGRVPNIEELSPQLLGRLLRSQVPIGPTFYRVVKVGEFDIIETGHRIDRPATAERLSMAIRETAGDIVSTEPLWMQLEKKEATK
ncbi:MAG: hypothetical protein U0744_03945 [Gemmataceae bacterium]